MKDEIKEILRDLEFASGVFDYTITPDRCTFLKDYITNLQEENERLSRTITDYDELLMQRNNIIDKVIEYLPEVRKTPSYELDEKIDNLENILNGG